MTVRIFRVACFPLAVLLWAAQLEAAEDGLAERGLAVLKTYCYDCHGVQFKTPDLHVLVRGSMVGTESEYILPGDAANSYLWQRIADGDMPPEGKPQPTEEERKALLDWINAGFEFPAVEKVAGRDFKSVVSMLQDILADLQASRESDRPYIRYFTLTHLYNNPDVTDQQYRLFQAAFSKVLNSVSWKPDIVLPRAIDAEKTIFRVDLRDVGLDERNLWQEILRAYPYGLTYDFVRDDEQQRLWKRIGEMTEAKLAYLRADWFAFAAAKPPLYHTLLDIPQTARELEERLRVNVNEDFLRNRLKRAGFSESGVSHANRLLDRHAAAHGAYWKSYDFAKNDGRGNLFQFPLGPKFAGNPFSEFSFEHDGGEIIFNLPNGLQGYMLINDKDERIDVGPSNVVADDTRAVGTTEVVNGISCMSCHKDGMRRFTDSVADGTGLFGEALNKVRELYPSDEEMVRFVDRDEKRFLAALEEAIGPLIRGPGDENRDIRRFGEPVSTLAKFYYRDVDLKQLACELGYEDPERVRTLIESNTQLQKLGLNPLLRNRTIKREYWESREGGISPYHRAALQLNLGTPLLILGGGSR